MARNTTPSLSLFPFLSVLLAAVGVMIVVFAGTVLTALDSTSQRWVVTVRDAPARKPGRQFDREPIYVVCDRQGLMVFWSPHADGMERITADELAGPDAQRLVRHVVDGLERVNAERWPVLFVKPSGLDAMQIIYNAIRQRNLRVGKFAFGEESEIFCELLDGMATASAKPAAGPNSEESPP